MAGTAMTFSVMMMRVMPITRPVMIMAAAAWFVVVMPLQLTPSALQGPLIFRVHHHKRRDPSRGIVHGFIHFIKGMPECKILAGTVHSGKKPGHRIIGAYTGRIEVPPRRQGPFKRVRIKGREHPRCLIQS